MSEAAAERHEALSPQTASTATVVSKAGESHEARDIETMRALTRVFDVLPRIGAAVLGLSAITYLAGWSDVSDYYRRMDAAWLLGAVPAREFVQESAVLIYVLATTVLVCAGYAARSKWEPASVGKWSAGLALAATVVIAVATFGAGRLSYGVALGIAELGSYVWAAAAGLLAVELVLRLRDAGLEWRATHLWLVTTMVSWGLFQAPSAIGQARAARDGDSKESPLPTVRSPSLPGGDWRLLRADGTRLVLVELGIPSRAFRVVTASDQYVIQSRNPPPEAH